MDPPLRVPPWLTRCYLSLFKLCNLTPTADRIRWWIIRRSGNRLLRWVSDKGMGTHMALLRGVEVRSYPGRLIYIEPERPWVRALNLLARMRTSWLKVARDGTEVYWTPGAHHSMLLPGHVECVSAILRDCLVRSDAANSATHSGLPRDPARAACGQSHAAFGGRCIPAETCRFAALIVALRSKYTRYSSLARLVSRAPRTPRHSRHFIHRLLEDRGRPT